MQCQFGQEFSRGGHRKCRCKITNGMCGFVYYCAPENRYKNTGGYENCLLRTKELSKQEEQKSQIQEIENQEVQETIESQEIVEVLEQETSEEKELEIIIEDEILEEVK